MNKRISVFKLTHDNWCGSYRLGDYYDGVKNPMLVEVIFNGNITSYMEELDPVWRTCVWGNDDLGMEFDCNSYEEAWAKFQEVIALDHVDQSKLKELGYVYA